MYFIFEIEFSSNKDYIAELIRGYATNEKIDIDVLQTDEKIIMVFDKEDKKTESFLHLLEEGIPASLFIGKGKHYFSEDKPTLMPIRNMHLPLNLAPCPSCQKEMFDVSSRRYYYPFTSCNSCGSQHPFLMQYPYNRANSSMKFLVPCEACETERQKNALRKDYPLISCIDCGITLRMQDKENEHLANDKGAYRKLFEVSGRAINSGQSVLMKTTRGYRKFFKPTEQDTILNSILLMADANGFNEHLMMVPQEFNALLSIERPLLRVATKSDELKALYGSSTLVKYPDDGMTMLLARELMNAGLTYISYVECDENENADFLVDFDLPIHPQKDTRLFINQDTKLFISGERILFPTAVFNRKDIVTVAHDLAAVKVVDSHIIDSMEIFDDVKTEALHVLESEEFESMHHNEKQFTQWEASMISVLAEHRRIGQKAVGVHFDGNLNFLYYNGKNVINAVPPIPFESDNLWEKIAALREGSDRLVDNYKKVYPNVYKRLNELNGNMDIFQVTAIALGLEDESFEGISSKALSFLGKGGLQIDTRVNKNRFDNYAFLTSIMSYQLAGVENNLMCYSIYESFGDYIGEIVPQLMEKTDATVITLTGETFANQSLYGRIQKTLGAKNPLMNRNLPIGKENAVYGALYL